MGGRRYVLVDLSEVEDHAVAQANGGGGVRVIRRGFRLPVGVICHTVLRMGV